MIITLTRPMDIITNNKPRMLADDADKVTYLGHTYALSDFTSICNRCPDELEGWHGIIHETHFSGVLIKIPPGDGDHVVMGRYSS